MIGELKTRLVYGPFSLYVSIEYKYIPGEERVMYDRDGSGYPGSPAQAELIYVKAEKWEDESESYERRDVTAVTAWWLMLDQMAFKHVDYFWGACFELDCLDDWQKQLEAED